MYVIVEIQGQQFKAEQGRYLYVHHIDTVKDGDTIEFDGYILKSLRDSMHRIFGLCHNPPDCDYIFTIRRILCIAKRFAVSVPT